jgi:hypothetical protein
MSTEGTATSAAGGTPAPPDDQQALQEEIERTRQHLGETVDALAAKADVKARAQQKARHLTGLLKSTAVQGRHRAATAVNSLSQATPESVKEAVDSAAATSRRHRVPLAAAVGAVVASVLAWLLIRGRRRRG